MLPFGFRRMWVHCKVRHGSLHRCGLWTSSPSKGIQHDWIKLSILCTSLAACWSEAAAHWHYVHRPDCAAGGGHLPLASTPSLSQS